MTSERPAGGAASLLGDDFDWSEAIGGWRGMAESVAPGGVFVTAFLVWGGFRVPVVAAVATVVARGEVRTYDMMKLRGGPQAIEQGAATTTQMTDAVIAELDG